MSSEERDPRPLFKQPTFYVVTLAFALFIYLQWPKNQKDGHVAVIANSEYSINFIKKPTFKRVEDLGLWLYDTSVSGVKFAVRFQEVSSAITELELQEIALKSFDKSNETFEYVVQEPTQYEKGYFWSVASENGKVRESFWVIAQSGWIEIISVYDSNKKGHEELALAFTDSLIKK